MARKIAVVSPELPFSAQVRSEIPSHAELFWFAEIEALFAYLFHENVDEILLDQRIIKDDRSCGVKYQKLIKQMHPRLKLSIIEVSTQSGLSFCDMKLNYFPLLEELFKQGELQSLFQPIVKPQHNQHSVLGFECLSRIRFNNKIFTPEFLFNYAQEKLLLTYYDKICLKQALRLAPRVPHMLIFVNVRPQTLIGPDFLPWFKDLLKINNLQSEQIIMEITEQHCIISEPEISAQCELLRHDGVRIAVDDFGCGISNHSMIDVMKPNFIKISGRFLKNHHTNIVKKKIIKNILDLSIDCHINAIVESVENKEDWDLVAHLGARLAQGFHFFKPMPYEEIKALLAKA